MKHGAFIVAIGIAALIAVYFTIQSPSSKPEPIPITPRPLPIERPPIPPELVACTMDAKQCPDGSYVGRVAPDCSFAPCPGY